MLRTLFRLSVLSLTAILSQVSVSSLAQADDKGFVSLFDGKTLQGWQGAVDGYDVIDGAIVCNPKKGGLLQTDKRYSDFAIRFDFQLEPGANNGLGLRAPMEGRHLREWKFRS